MKRLLLCSFLLCYLGWILSIYNLLKLMVEKIPVQVNIIAFPITLIVVTLVSVFMLYVVKMVHKNK